MRGRPAGRYVRKTGVDLTALFAPAFSIAAARDLHAGVGDVAGLQAVAAPACSAISTSRGLCSPSA